MNMKKSSIAVVMGSDAVAGYRGGDAKEIECMVTNGMTPSQAIWTATFNAAHLLGWQDGAGTIEPGKFADIIAVSGDPMKDITEPQSMKFLMKGGA